MGGRGSGGSGALRRADPGLFLTPRVILSRTINNQPVQPTMLVPTCRPMSAGVPSPKSSAFLETIVTFLLPYFTIATADSDHARIEIVETLASYAARTRAEMLQAAQIIALGMTTLDVLAEVKTTEMSASMRIRFRGCANGLNRSTIQMEKALDRRLACDLQTAPEPRPGPVNDIPDAEWQAEIEQTQAMIERIHAEIGLHRAPASEATGKMREGPNQISWAGAMRDTMRQPVQPIPGG